MSPATPTSDWTIQDTLSVDGCTIKPGAKIRVAGEKGTFTFVRLVSRPDGHHWIDAIGGPPGCTKFRSFRPERITPWPVGPTPT